MARLGRLANRIAGALAGAGKTDTEDAFTLAEPACLRGDPTPLTALDQIAADLRILTARREGLTADRVRGVNRSRDLPAGIFPALERAFDYSSRSPLLLPTYCAPATSWPAGAGRLAEQPREHRAWPETIASIVETTLGAASEQTTVPPSEAITAPLISRLARQLLDLDREIKDLDNQITRTFDEPSHAGSITRVDGFGPILCAQPLADAGDRRAAFGNPGRLAAYVGLAPAPRGSGRVRGGLHRPQRFHLGPRRVF